MTPSETVTAFCDAVSRSALDEAMVFIADDCAYHNIPMPLVEGAAGVRATLAGFIQLLGSLRIETLRQIVVGEWVMNERLDHFDPPGGSSRPARASICSNSTLGGVPYCTPPSRLFLRAPNVCTWRELRAAGTRAHFPNCAAVVALRACRRK